MSFTPSHSRSKSYAYGVPAPLPPPPTDANSLPVDFHIPPSPLYRRHMRKKSSQILIEPIGAPKTNYMPVSPTITVPPALQTIFKGTTMNEEKKFSPLRTFQYPTPSPGSSISGYTYAPAENGQYDLPADLSLDSVPKRQLNTYIKGAITPTEPSNRAVRTHRKSHTISHRSMLPMMEDLEYSAPEIGLTRQRSIKRESSGESDFSSLGRSSSTSTLFSLDMKRDIKSDFSLLSPPLLSVPRNDFNLPITYMYSARMLAKSAGYRILGQILSKLLVVVFSHLVLKFVSPKIFGASLQFELLMTTACYFVRESIRLATQRQTLAGKQPDLYRFEGGVVEHTLSGTIQMVVNLGFIPVLVGIPLISLLSYLYIHWEKWGAGMDPRSMTLAVIIFGISAVIELFAEPGFLLMQLRMRFRKRIVFESLATLTRCLLTFAFIMLGRHKGAVIIAFALGQLGYSLVLATCYTYTGLKDAQMNQFELTYPRGVWTEGNSSTKIYFDGETKTLAKIIWLQMLFKRCLAEGDKYVVSLLLPLSDQSMYTLMVKYGLIATQLLFEPIEDALRNFFSKLLVAPVSKVNEQLSVMIVSTLLRFYFYLLVFMAFFSPVICGYVLQSLVPNEWVGIETSTVITYACYLPLLAVNGLFDSFIQSVASPSSIKRQSTAMLGINLTFGLSQYLLMQPLGLGVQGLVLANMFNMAQRIGWSIMWIEGYYSRMRLEAIEGRAKNTESMVEREVDAMGIAEINEDEGEMPNAFDEKAGEADENKDKDEGDEGEDEGEESDSTLTASTTDVGNTGDNIPFISRLFRRRKPISTTMTDTPSSRTSDITSSSSSGVSSKHMPLPKVTITPEQSHATEGCSTHRENSSSPPLCTTPAGQANTNTNTKTFVSGKRRSSGMQYQEKPWGWLLVAIPRPLVFGVIASLAPMVWFFVGPVETLRGFVQQVSLAGILMLSICVSEWPVLKQVVKGGGDEPVGQS